MFLYKCDGDYTSESHLCLFFSFDTVKVQITFQLCKCFQLKIVKLQKLFFSDY